MAITHSHNVHKDTPATHVDSFGTEFGDDVHKAAASKVKWVEGQVLFPATHVHKGVDSEAHPLSNMDVWKVRTKNSDDEDDVPTMTVVDANDQTVVAGVPTPVNPGAPAANPVVVNKA